MIYPPKEYKIPMSIKQEQRSWMMEHTEIPDHTFPINIFHIYPPYRGIIPPHWHDHLEWIRITRGRFRLQIGSAFYDLREGEIAFVNKAEIHAAFPEEDNSELTAVVFNESLLRNSVLDNIEVQYIRPLMLGDVQLPSFYTSEQNATSEILNCLDTLIHCYSRKNPGYELQVKGQLLCTLGLAFGLVEVDYSHGRESSTKDIIRPLLVYLSNHYHEPLTVEEAARICCVTPNYLCHIFKKSTGRTLIEYINMLRIHEAGRLLQLREHSLQQVALQVGFTNHTYFGRVFRKFKNMSPSEYVESLIHPGPAYNQ
jgi:AraC family transcriptional regulator, transcriptional activator of pobA